MDAPPLRRFTWLELLHPLVDIPYALLTLGCAYNGAVALGWLPMPGWYDARGGAPPALIADFIPWFTVFPLLLYFVYLAQANRPDPGDELLTDAQRLRRLHWLRSLILVGPLIVYLVSIAFLNGMAQQSDGLDWERRWPGRTVQDSAIEELQTSPSTVW